MKKTILTLMFCIVLLGTASAATNPCGNENSYAGTFKQGDVVSLKQVCDTCSHVNISRINYPDSSFNNIESVMTKAGINYNLSFTDTFKAGCHSYDVYGDKGGVENTTETIDFKITPSGQEGGENTAFIILIIVLVYGIALFGFFGRNEWVAIIGGLAMMFLGVYTVNNGIVIFRDTFTVAISYFTIGLGGFFTLFTLLEIIKENYG